jgi:PBSX family phage portal protein
MAAVNQAEEVLARNQYVAKVIPIQVKKDTRGVSRSLPEDPFESFYGTEGIIEPPYDLFTLAMMPEASSELGPAIEAMVVNIEKLGYRIVPRDGMRKGEDALTPQIKQERSLISNFFANAVLEPNQTFTSLREAWRHDLETTGNAYIEVIPTVMTGDPAGLNQLPSWQMRLRKEDDDYTECEVKRAVQQPDGSWKIETFPYRKRFRRFVQIRENQTEKVYFKEWGDPRDIDSRTGEPVTDEVRNSEDWNDSYLATSVIHLKLYCSRSPYGIPRWIGNLFTIFGNRAAEVINYTTFRSNNIPAMMLLATNVQLTEASIERIQKFVEERIQGDDNYSTILLVEGEPIAEGMKDPGTMKLDVKELTQVQHTDALFVNYMERNDDKIRRAFRLPPIFMGRADDYTRATADSSRKVGEEQVFRPERNHEDSIWNQTIVAALNAANVLFRSNTPDVTDNYELTQLLAVAERSGGLSPFVSRVIVEDVLGRDLPELSEDIPHDLPFTLTMLREQLSGEAAAAGTTTDEVAMQLRELKSLMSQNEAITEENHKQIDTLIKLMEMNEPALPAAKARSCDDEEKAHHDEDEDEMEKTIREVDGQYCVFSEDGQTNFGCYDTMGEAEERLAQVESFSEKRVPIDKVFKATADEERIVGGAVLVPGVVDLQGDTYDADTTTAAAYYWLEHYQEDPRENGIKFMHEGEVIFDAARPIQSFVLDREMEFEVEVPAAGDDHPAKELTTLTYPKGTWILYARIRDDVLWEKFKKGEIKGWSIGGVALVQQLKGLTVPQLPHKHAGPYR